MPTISRASVDLPDALGPMIASVSPAFSCSETPLIIICWRSLKPNTTRSSASAPAGAGRVVTTFS